MTRLLLLLALFACDGPATPPAPGQTTWRLAPGVHACARDTSVIVAPEVDGMSALWTCIAQGAQWLCSEKYCYRYIGGS